MINVISDRLLKFACLAVCLMTTGYASATPLNPVTWAGNCIGDHLLNCSVVAFATIRPEAAPSVAIQIQSGYTEEDGIRAGVVIHQLKRNGWHLLYEDYQGVHYDLPGISEGETSTLLHISGQRAGTGIGNADLLFASASELSPWVPVDIESWKDTISEQLPEGLQIWHGVDYNFGDWAWTDYSARTELWRESDANCCPTGGEAVILFDIVDNVLTTKSVTYHPPASDAE